MAIQLLHRLQSNAVIISFFSQILSLDFDQSHVKTLSHSSYAQPWAVLGKG